MQNVSNYKTPLVSFDDCRHRIELTLEDNIKIERDFIDYMEFKWTRIQENEKFISSGQWGVKSDADQKNRVNHPSGVKKPSDGDDQDMMPMDLDDDQEEQKRGFEEEKKKSEDQPQLKYIERCAKIGRIGPREVKLDWKTAFGELLSKEDYDVEAVGSFASIRANTGVFKARFYYEVQLKTNGLMQIGWSTIQTPFNT